MKNKLSDIVGQFLNNSKINFDKKELFFQIQSHPSYPSLHSITGVLDHFNIENIAAQIPVNLDTLKQLPDNFIAQINNEKGKDLVTIKKNNDNYTVIKGIKNKEKLSSKQFVDKFTGIIVAVEKPEKEISIINSKSAFKNFLNVSILLVALMLLLNYNTSILNISFLILSFVGILISVAIFKQELGLETIIGNAFCSGGTEKKDCDGVLTSKGATIIKGYKLSDFSLLYFTVLFFATIIQLEAPKIPLLISFVALPIIIYSIYYQYFVLKKWCLLCLTIIAVLVAQAILSYFIGFNFYKIGLNESLEILLLFFTAFLTWHYLKPVIFEITTLRKEKIKSFKFQRNFDIFKAMLHKNKKIDTYLGTIPNNKKEIILGNVNSKLEIVVITNPFCGHCKPVHQSLEKILEKYHNEIKLVIRFSVNTENINSDGVAITTKLIEMYNEKDKKEAISAMSDIYDGMPTKIWLEKWGNCVAKEKQIELLKVQRDWCINNKINFTPEILINGYSFPKQYLKADLKYYIEDLLETS